MEVSETSSFEHPAPRLTDAIRRHMCICAGLTAALISTWYESLIVCVTRAPCRRLG